MSIMKPVLTAKETEDYLNEVFPQIKEGGDAYIVEDVRSMAATLRLVYSDRNVRPGGTISGPTMFTLADLALYVTVLAHIGREALAVTTNLNINFLRKPQNTDLIGECRLLKLGKRLAVGTVSIVGASDGEIVAHANGTYSIPPKSQ